MRWKGSPHCMRLISASRMTSRLSSRVPWNWRKRGRRPTSLSFQSSRNEEKKNCPRNHAKKTRKIWEENLRGDSTVTPRSQRSERVARALIPEAKRGRFAYDSERALLLPSGVDADCDWPVVDQINFHVRTENASAHRLGGFCLELLAEFFVTLDGHLRCSRGNKRWSVAFSSAG